MRDLIIYTDGASRNNANAEKRVGAWGCMLYCPQMDRMTYHCDVVPTATNNTMEIAAMFKALRTVKNVNFNVTIYSDSKYVVDFCNDWRYKWRAKNWNVDKKNLNLFRILDRQLDRFENIKVCHVRGHAGVLGNEIVDRLCNLALDGRVLGDDEIILGMMDKFKKENGGR